MPEAPQCLYRRYSGMCACARNGITCSREGATVQGMDLTTSETDVARAFVQLFPSDLEDVAGRPQDKLRNIGRQLKAQAAKMFDLVQADATLPEKLSWKAWNGLLPVAQQKHTSTGECFECVTQFPEAMQAIALRDARDRAPKKRKRRGTGDTKPLATLYCACACKIQPHAVNRYRCLPRNSVGTSTALQLLLQTTVFFNLGLHDS